MRRLYNCGFHMGQINVGNMGGRQNTAMLKKAVSVSEKDIEDFLYLAEKGVTITAQMVPTDEAVDFTALLKSRSFQS
ncbi:MAG: PTS sugar transporter subunit IIB [Hungatella sp.]|nr:PTS sugar transporter subunit IIB [Hungatella sp.]